MPKNKVDSSIDIVVQVMDEAQQRHREQFGNALMEKIAEHTDKTIHQKLVLPNDITRFSPLWQAERRYLSYKRAEGIAAATIKNIETFFDYLHAFIALFTIELEDLKNKQKNELLAAARNTPLFVLETEYIEEMFRRYLEEEKEMAPTSIGTLMVQYNAFYKFCSVELEVLQLKNIKVNRAQPPIKALYTDEQLDILLEKPKDFRSNFIEHRDWLIVMYAYNTGNRRKSIANIQMKDLEELTEGFVLVNTTKNKKPQRVVVPQKLVMLMREYIKIWRSDATPEDYLFTNQYGEQMSPDYLGHAIARYNRKRLGPNAPTSIHLFRHQYAAEYIKDEGSMFDLQKQLGHSSLAMVKHYAEHYGKPNSDNISSHAPINRRKQTHGREKLKPNK